MLRTFTRLHTFTHLLKQGSSPPALALWVKYTEIYYPVRINHKLVMD